MVGGNRCLTRRLSLHRRYLIPFEGQAEAGEAGVVGEGSGDVDYDLDDGGAGRGDQMARW